MKWFGVRCLQKTAKTIMDKYLKETLDLMLNSAIREKSNILFLVIS